MARPKLLTPNFILKRRKDGYYDIRYQENGKTKQASTGTKSIQEAEIFRAQFASQYAKPDLSPSPTISEVIDAYIEHRTPLVASPETLVYVFAAPKRYIGNLKAEEFGQTDVAAYIKKRSQDKTQGRYAGRQKADNVSEATINKELRMLRAAFNWAYNDKLIARQPNFRIELTNGRVRDEWITKEEANRLVEAAADHIALYVLIALSTAKRRGAILDLTWDRVHLDRPGHEFIDFGEDVGNKRRGTVPIAGNKRLIEALRYARRQTESNYVIEAQKSRTGPKGKLSDVKTGLKAACKRARIRQISTHVLKHTAITWMVQAGVSFERIAKFSNTSVEIIERVYGHHSPSFVQEATDAVVF